MGLLSDVKQSFKAQEAAQDAQAPVVAPPAYPAQSSSQLPPPVVQGGGPFFPCVLLSSSDKIRILGFPNEHDIKMAIDTSISRVWAPGIQRSNAFEAGGWEWKLSGRPWYGYKDEGTHARRLVTSILYELCIRGWHLLVSSSLTKKEWDKDTLIFKAGPPVQRYFFPVSYHESDKIRIIDSPNQDVTQSIIQAVRNTWTPGIQDQKQRDANSYQVKLKGRPWYTSDGPIINHARIMLTEILKAMDAHGFELLASVDMTIGQAGSDSGITDIDTWFFVSKM